MGSSLCHFRHNRVGNLVRSFREVSSCASLFYIGWDGCPCHRNEMETEAACVVLDHHDLPRGASSPVDCVCSLDHQVGSRRRDRALWHRGFIRNVLASCSLSGNSWKGRKPLKDEDPRSESCVKIKGIPRCRASSSIEIFCQVKRLFNELVGKPLGKFPRMPLRLRTGPRGAVPAQCLQFLPGQAELVDILDLFQRDPDIEVRSEEESLDVNSPYLLSQGSSR